MKKCNHDLMRFKWFEVRDNVGFIRCGYRAICYKCGKYLTLQDALRREIDEQKRPSSGISKKRK